MTRPVTLWEYYQRLGQPLPTVQERRPLWEELGLGRGAEYLGTAQQNPILLRALIARDAAAPAMAAQGKPEDVRAGAVVQQPAPDATASFLDRGAVVGMPAQPQIPVDDRAAADVLRRQQIATAGELVEHVRGRERFVETPEQFRAAEEARLARDREIIGEQYRVAGEEARWAYQRGMEQVDRARALIPGMFAVPREAIDMVAESVFDLGREYNMTLRRLAADEQTAIAARDDRAATNIRQAIMDYHNVMDGILTRTLELMDYQYRLHRIPIDEEKQEMKERMQVALNFPLAGIDIEKDDYQTMVDKIQSYVQDHPEEQLVTLRDTLYAYNKISGELRPLATKPAEVVPERITLEDRIRLEDRTRREAMAHRMSRGIQIGDLVQAGSAPDGSPSYNMLESIDQDGNPVRWRAVAGTSPEAVSAIERGALIWPQGSSFKPLVDPNTGRIAPGNYISYRLLWQKQGLPAKDFDNEYQLYLSESARIGLGLTRPVADTPGTLQGYTELELIGGADAPADWRADWFGAGIQQQEEQEQPKEIGRVERQMRERFPGYVEIVRGRIPTSIEEVRRSHPDYQNWHKWINPETERPTRALRRVLVLGHRLGFPMTEAHEELIPAILDMLVREEKLKRRAR